jgi:LAS superfamily LD-carboxypeptidase LdcB
MSNVELTAKQIIGLDEQHLTPVDAHQLDQHTAEAFLAMQEAALQEGFALSLASGYRSFERQLNIWNQKVLGKRPVLDLNSQPIDISQCSPDQLIHNILNWSALPGCSRHHWGTDFDFFDANQIEVKQLKLIPEEYEGGVCNNLYQWLKKHAGEFHFFWPYASHRGGIQIEPWHLSYAPKANPALLDFPEDLLRTTLEASNLELKHTVLEKLPHIIKQYIYNIDTPDFSS